MNSIAAWIRLMQTPGVGPETARKLLKTFGLPESIFSAALAELRKAVTERIAFALLAPPDSKTQALIDKTLQWSQQEGNHVLTLADDCYPKALLNITDPPALLYAKGRIELLHAPAIGVVGSRNATVQGNTNAEQFSSALSQAGLTIVSGMALGIDTAAHLGGLAGKGSTVAVIGTGIDIVYPARNRTLAHRIASEGCLLSEYPLGMPAIATNFPRRNRIISGLTRGILVVEAAAQSGSLITARLAAEQGRDVFAIPGSIHSPLAKGCHQLIKQGAKLIESAHDILEEFFPQSTNLPMEQPVAKDLAEASHPLLAFMGFDPIDIDTLAARCDLDAASVSAQLFALEMDGFIEAMPGGIYRRL